MTDPAIPNLLTDADLAAALRVKPRTIREWAARGDLPAPVIDRDRCKRWHPCDIARWLEQKRQRA